MAFVPPDDDPDREPSPDADADPDAALRNEEGHRMEFGEWVGLGVIGLLKDREEPEPDIERPELEELFDSDGFELREVDPDPDRDADADDVEGEGEGEGDPLEGTDAWIRIADPIERIP